MLIMRVIRGVVITPSFIVASSLAATPILLFLADSIVFRDSDFGITRVARSARALRLMSALFMLPREMAQWTRGEHAVAR